MIIIPAQSGTYRHYRRRVTALLADSGLITVRGYGHTELANPSTCAQNYIARYLIKGTFPTAGAACNQNTPPFH
ncbi:MAG: alpha/beta hydrolase [Streptosporangiaceae bacterium]|jgi:hypothetical protein